MMPSNSDFPQNSARARINAATMARGSTVRVLQLATHRLRLTASISRGVSTSALGSGGCGEAVLPEYVEGGRRFHEIQERLGVRSLAGRRARDRVDDRGMAVRWEGADDLDALVPLGGRLVDDAEQRLAARYEGQRRADAFGPDQLRLDLA